MICCRGAVAGSGQASPAHLPGQLRPSHHPQGLGRQDLCGRLWSVWGYRGFDDDGSDYGGVWFCLERLSVHFLGEGIIMMLQVGPGCGYMLTVAGFNRTLSTLGDAMAAPSDSSHNGMKFSTKWGLHWSCSSGLEWVLWHWCWAEWKFQKNISYTSAL